MFNAFLEAIGVLFYTIWNFGLAIGKALYQLLGIPTTQYGLVKYIVENNLLLLNSASLTKIIMFVTPLIVSHLIVYLCDLFRIRAIKVKEGISIVLYLIILYAFSMWQFWLIIGIITLFIIVVLVLSNIKSKKIA